MRLDEVIADVMRRTDNINRLMDIYDEDPSRYSLDVVFHDVQQASFMAGMAQALMQERRAAPKNVDPEDVGDAMLEAVERFFAAVDQLQSSRSRRDR